MKQENEIGRVWRLYFRFVEQKKALWEDERWRAT